MSSKVNERFVSAYLGTNGFQNKNTKFTVHITINIQTFSKCRREAITHAHPQIKSTGLKNLVYSVALD
jgi:hypothetical protein